MEKKSSELESSDYERETSLNTKKINFIKANNKNKNDNIATKKEKFIKLDENGEDKNINMKLNCVINVLKVIYYRKIANFILDGLVKKYPNSLGVTSSKFYNQRSKFNLVIAIEEINIYQINLIVDFLMHTKEKASSIIHINEKTYVQKTIFNLYIKNIRNKRDDSNNSIEEIIKIDEMVKYIEEIIDLNEDENENSQIKSIIKNVKAKIIEENNDNNVNDYIDNIDNENNIGQKSGDSSISNYEYDVNKLQRILDGKENINLLVLLKHFIKK